MIRLVPTASEIVSYTLVSQRQNGLGTGTREIVALDKLKQRCMLQLFMTNFIQGLAMNVLLRGSSTPKPDMRGV